MGVPSTTDILRVWDAGAVQDHPGRALLMLSMADRHGAAGDPGTLGIGARDGMLLELRSRLFGSRVDSASRCEACGVELGVAFDLADIRVASPDEADGRVLVRSDGYEITARLPATADLVAIRGARDARLARERLLGRCVTHIGGPEEIVTAAELPEKVQAEIARALAEADPQAHIELLLQCAACGHEASIVFDIVRYLWAEIEQYGLQTLREVHRLARAYGWTEQETLSLSPQRRRRYLEMVSDE